MSTPLHDQLREEAARSRQIDASISRLTARTAPAAGAEAELVARAQSGDAAARARLVERFLPLIAGVARTYRTSEAITRTELLQEGVVGLLRAVERFDAGRGTPFWAYAGWWVRQAMQQLVAELTRPTVMSDRALRHLARLREARQALVARDGREPTPAELARHSGIPLDQVEDLLAAERPAPSLDAFGDLVADPLAENEYERVLDAVVGQELLDLLSGLSDRERAIVRARFGLDGPEESLREVAERLGVSPERVRQLERRALAKLAAAAGAD